MKQLLDCVARVFPACDTSHLGPESRLDSIPNWDSMNGVNLMMEIEGAFGVNLFEHDVILEGRHTIADVLALIERWRAP